ncbi:MAG: hypothetical protein ACREQF_00185 [Candidatus Binataceae bacterium]
MNGLTDIGNALRKMGEAYAQALSNMNAAAGELRDRPGEERNRTLEYWLRIARMSKDGFVAAIDQGFELWEREMRRALTAAPARKPAARRPRRAKKAPTNPLDAWTENLSKTAQSVREALESGELGTRARKQAEQFANTLQDGLKAWQRLWQPPSN